MKNVVTSDLKVQFLRSETRGSLSPCSGWQGGRPVVLRVTSGGRRCPGLQRTGRWPGRPSVWSSPEVWLWGKSPATESLLTSTSWEPPSPPPTPWQVHLTGNRDDLLVQILNDTLFTDSQWREIVEAAVRRVQSKERVWEEVRRVKTKKTLNLHSSFVSYFGIGIRFVWRKTTLWSF